MNSSRLRRFRNQHLRVESGSEQLQHLTLPDGKDLGRSTRCYRARREINIGVHDMRILPADLGFPLSSDPGLRPVSVSKTWIHNGNTLGGFHVFTSREAADAYLGSDMAAGLIANPAFSDFAIDHYEIIDGLSAITGSPQISLAA